MQPSDSISSRFRLGALVSAPAPPRRRRSDAYVQAQAAPEPPPRRARHRASTGLPRSGPAGPDEAAAGPRRRRRANAAKPQGAARSRSSPMPTSKAAQAPERATTSTRSSSTPTSRARSTRFSPRRCASPTSRSSPARSIVGQPASRRHRPVGPRPGQVDASGVEQWHVYLKPTRPDLETNLAINTDRRSYLLELHSYADTYMAAIVWRFPAGRARAAQAQAAELAGTQKNVGARRRPRRPRLQLHDPGRQGQTGVDAGAGLRRRPPHLRALSRSRCSCARRPRSSCSATSETQLVNYRVKNDMYVIDRLIDAAELRVGSKDQEIVRIARAARRAAATARARGEGPMTTAASRDCAEPRPRSTRTRPSSRPTTRASRLGRPRGRTLRSGPSPRSLASLLGAGRSPSRWPSSPPQTEDASGRRPSAAPPPPVVPGHDPRTRIRGEPPRSRRRTRGLRASVPLRGCLGRGPREAARTSASSRSKARGAGILFESGRALRQRGAPPAASRQRRSPERPVTIQCAAPTTGPSNPNMQERQERLSRRRGRRQDDRLSAKRRSQHPRSPYEIKAGTILPAVLITAINSDLPGPVIGQVRENVYDTVTGNHLLIPQGSRFSPNTTRWSPGARSGSSSAGTVSFCRTATRWTSNACRRPILQGAAGLDRRGQRALVAHPEGRRRRLAPRGDGRSVRGRRHELFNPTVGQIMARSASAEINQVGAAAHARNLSIQPTITVRPGFSVNVIVTKDMIVPPYPDPPEAPGACAMSDLARRPAPRMTVGELEAAPRSSRPRARRASRALACLLGSHLLWNWTPSLPLGLYWVSPPRCRPRRCARRVSGPRQRARRSSTSGATCRPGAMLVKPVVARASDGSAPRAASSRSTVRRLARSPPPTPAAGRCPTTRAAARSQAAWSSSPRICARASTRARSALWLSPSSEER